MRSGSLLAARVCFYLRADRVEFSSLPAGPLASLVLACCQRPFFVLPSFVVCVHARSAVSAGSSSSNKTQGEKAPLLRCHLHGLNKEGERFIVVVMARSPFFPSFWAEKSSCVGDPRGSGCAAPHTSTWIRESLAICLCTTRITPDLHGAGCRSAAPHCGRQKYSDDGQRFDLETRDKNIGRSVRGQGQPALSTAILHLFSVAIVGAVECACRAHRVHDRPRVASARRARA